MNNQDVTKKVTVITDILDEYVQFDTEREIQAKQAVKKESAIVLILSVLDGLEKVVREGSLEGFTEYRLRDKLAQESELGFK